MYLNILEIIEVCPWLQRDVIGLAEFLGRIGVESFIKRVEDSCISLSPIKA